MIELSDRTDYGRQYHLSVISIFVVVFRDHLSLVFASVLVFVFSSLILQISSIAAIIIVVVVCCYLGLIDGLE